MLKALLRTGALAVLVVGLAGCVGMQSSVKTSPTLTFVEPDVSPLPLQVQDQGLAVTQLDLPKPVLALHERANIQPTQKEIACMAEALIAEAGGEGDLGMIAVGYVVLNRAGANALNSRKFRSTACGVVFQKDRTRSGKIGCQFSWVCSPSKRSVKRHAKYDRALELARLVILHEVENPVNDAVFFNVKRLRPSHVRGKPLRAQIGNHNFYAAI